MENFVTQETSCFHPATNSQFQIKLNIINQVYNIWRSHLRFTFAKPYTAKRYLYNSGRQTSSMSENGQ